MRCEHVDRRDRQCLRGWHVDPLHSYRPLRKRSRTQDRRARALALNAETCARRAGGLCEARCSDRCVGRGEHAHHVIRRSQGGTDDLINLLWVCGPCHAHIHANPDLARDAGLLGGRAERVTP